MIKTKLCVIDGAPLQLNRGDRFEPVQVKSFGMRSPIEKAELTRVKSTLLPPGPIVLIAVGVVEPQAVNDTIVIPIKRIVLIAQSKVDFSMSHRSDASGARPHPRTKSASEAAVPITRQLFCKSSTAAAVTPGK